MTIEQREDLALDLHLSGRFSCTQSAPAIATHVRCMLDTLKRRAGVGDETVLLLLVEARRDERAGVRELVRIVVGQADRATLPARIPSPRRGR